MSACLDIVFALSKAMIINLNITIWISFRYKEKHLQNNPKDGGALVDKKIS